MFPSTHLHRVVLANLGTLLAAGGHEGGLVTLAAGVAGQGGTLVGVGIGNKPVSVVGDGLEEGKEKAGSTLHDKAAVFGGQGRGRASTARRCLPGQVRNA